MAWDLDKGCSWVNRFHTDLTVVCMLTALTTAGIFAIVFAFYQPFMVCFMAFQPEAILKRVERVEGDLLKVLDAGIIRLISVDWLLSQPPDWIAVRRQVRRAMFPPHVQKNPSPKLFDHPVTPPYCTGRNCPRKPS